MRFDAHATDRAHQATPSHLERPLHQEAGKNEEMMIPTIGRIVHYTLSADDAEMINRRREDSAAHRSEHVGNANGVQIHVGNSVAAGDVFPMMITRVWGNDETTAVNGQVMLDGNDLYWITSAHVGEGQRHFAWPVHK